MIAPLKGGVCKNGSQGLILTVSCTVLSSFEVYFGEIDTTLRGHDLSK